MSAWDTDTGPAQSYYLDGLTKRQRRKAATDRDRHYFRHQSDPEPAKNTTSIAMLMTKNPYCGYCGCKLTYETAELDKNDIAGPALACSRCNDRSR